MSETKTYTLGKIKQLIDLNGDTTNFNLTFKVTCHDNTPFNVLVVDQTTLDNSPELEYKEAVKEMSGNIVADKNIYQNYFLILKSETPCVVDVQIDKKPLPITPNFPINDLHPTSTINKKVHSQLSNNITSPNGFINWKKIGLIVLVCLIAGGVLWYLYKRKPSNIVTTAQEPTIYTIGNTAGNKNKNENVVGNEYQSLMHFSKNKGGSQFKNSPTNSDNLMASKAYKSPSVVSPVRSEQSEECGASLLYRLKKFAGEKSI